MKTFGAFALLLAGVLLSTPVVTAQSNGQGIGVADFALAAPIPYDGSAVVNVTVNVGCITAAQMGSIVITAPSAPAWLTVTAPSTTAGAPNQSCANTSGSKQVLVPVTFKVAKSAPGVLPQSVNLTATLGSSSDTAAAGFSVEYSPDYEILVNATFPLEVKGGQVSFNVTAIQKSNARSMIMMENVSTTAGSLSGLASVVYEADNLTKVFLVTYKAPTGAWTNASATFTSYTHSLPLMGAAGDFMLPKSFNWTFVNGGSSGGNDAGPSDPKEKKSPGPIAPIVVLGLLALVAITRRR